jgi:hypothetical protein
MRYFSGAQLLDLHGWAVHLPEVAGWFLAAIFLERNGSLSLEHLACTPGLAPAS